MPELPEVETIRRSLEERIVGRSITDVTLRNFPGVIGGADPDEFRGALQGLTVHAVERMGKYLRLRLDSGQNLVIHLRMTGQLVIVPKFAAPLRFEHLALGFGDIDLRFADQRKFGRVLLTTDSEADGIALVLGVEPLSDQFTAESLQLLLRNRQAPIKAFLLDQRRIAGVGNIYADEALFRARIHPMRAAGSLADEEVASLVTAIRTVLEEGLLRRGTTFSSYRDANGVPGDNVANLRVYGRGGKEICDTCGALLSKMTVAGRGTHLCSICQPLDRQSPSSGR
jgi:formamidopyrimidine-DNA glycosylase